MAEGPRILAKSFLTLILLTETALTSRLPVQANPNIYACLQLSNIPAAFILPSPLYLVLVLIILDPCAPNLPLIYVCDTFVWWPIKYHVYLGFLLLKYMIPYTWLVPEVLSLLKEGGNADRSINF